MIEITSKENLKVKNVCKLMSDKKHRKSQGVFVCEGPVMLQEAQNRGAEILEIYCTAAHIDWVMNMEMGEKYFVTDSLLQQMSDVKTPQGIVFVCREMAESTHKPGSILVLEDLRDSGNMGTVLRTADGLGVDNIVFIGDCVELYNPKTVRASMGSIFRKRPMIMDIQGLRALCSAQNIPLYATALSEVSVDIRTVDLKNAAVIIGNEARGVSEQAQVLADKHVIIPIQSAQSFNASVAAAIVLWEMSR